MSGLDVLCQSATQQVPTSIKSEARATSPLSPPPSPTEYPSTRVLNEQSDTKQPQDEPPPMTTPYDYEPAPGAPSTRTTPKRITTSHFFAPPPKPRTGTPSAPQAKAARRPARGTVSALPFPALDAPRFGLIQEELAGDPFGLLIAVTFLIRTPGRTAIPAFRALMRRYPTPAALAAVSDAEVETDIVPAIRHLGLASVRAAAILRYARAWVRAPPAPGVRYPVRNYPVRPPGDTAATAPALLDGDGEDQRGGEKDLLFVAPPGEAGSRTSSSSSSAWEIGHMTQGRYALDSWRIFCRDTLLGRADDWRGNGSGRRRGRRRWREGKEETENGNGDGDGDDPTFQPEWMRVRPEDKELRAYLRWLWMQEGWDWDPRTGERAVLAPALCRAVQEGRVRWDVCGRLEILEEGGGGGGEGEG